MSSGVKLLVGVVAKVGQLARHDVVPPHELCSSPSQPEISLHKESKLTILGGILCRGKAAVAGGASALQDGDLVRGEGHGGYSKLLGCN